MDLTYSKQFKKYIKEQNDLGYPQTIYKFSNGYGASVIKLNYIYFGIEIAVLRFDENGNWGIDYSTPITNDVIGGLNEESRDSVLQQIFDLKEE
jgi:complete genome